MRRCQRVHLFSKRWPHLVIPFYGRWGSSIEKKFIVFMLFGAFCMCGCGYFVSIVKQKEKKLFKLWSCHSSLSPCKESMAFIDFVDFALSFSHENSCFMCLRFQSHFRRQTKYFWKYSCCLPRTKRFASSSFRTFVSGVELRARVNDALKGMLRGC